MAIVAARAQVRHPGSGPMLCVNWDMVDFSKGLKAGKSGRE